MRGFSAHLGMNTDKKWSFVVTDYETGTLRPKDKNGNTCRFFGLRLSLGFGEMKRPVPKLYHWKFLFGTKKEKDTLNPWNSGNHWFVMHLKNCPLIFLSGFSGDEDKAPGFYIGMKTYRVDQVSMQLRDFKSDKFYPGTEGVGEGSTFQFNKDGSRVLAWGKMDDWHKYYLCPSISTKKNFYT